MEAKPRARLVARRVVAIARREKAAKHYPANHRCKNEPKLRVNSSIDSHVILHGRPLLVKFLARRKLQATRLMRCRAVKGPELARSAIVVNPAAAANGKIWLRPDPSGNAATRHLSSNPANAATARWFGNRACRRK